MPEVVKEMLKNHQHSTGILKKKERLPQVIIYPAHRIGRLLDALDVAHVSISQRGQRKASPFAW